MPISEMLVSGGDIGSRICVRWMIVLSRRRLRHCAGIPSNSDLLDKEFVIQYAHFGSVSCLTLPDEDARRTGLTFPGEPPYSPSPTFPGHS